MKLLILYFSATGNTKQVAKVMGDTFTQMGCEVTLSDMTPYADRQKKIDLIPYDAVVFGAPIHSRRAPRVVREWMESLDGQYKKSAMFFTYGGFGVHSTHFSTRRILEKQNFIVVASAEFLGFHTFNIGGWKAMEGRPDESDFDVAKEYTRIIYKRFTGEDKKILGVLEKTNDTEQQLDSIEASRFKVLTHLPGRGEKECRMCLVCENLCPTNAFDARSGKSDPDKCIACLSCVISCPENGMIINNMSESWLFKLQTEKTTLEKLNSLKSKIYM